MCEFAHHAAREISPDLGQGSTLFSAVSATEAALEAWAESSPDGYTLPEVQAFSLLLTLAAHLPGNDKGLAARARKIEQIMPSRYGGSFTKLQPDGGQVHFLHFWRSFSEAVRVIRDDGCSNVAEPSGAEGLVVELEGLRDVVLDYYEAGGQHIVSSNVIEVAVREFEAKSVAPDFWQAVQQSMAGQTDPSDLGLDDVTVLLLSWLHDAIMWQHAPAVNLRTGMLPLNLRTGMLPEAQWTNTGFHSTHRASAMSTSLRPATRGEPCSLMASAALLLDLQEHWRAAGNFDTTEFRARAPSNLTSLLCSPRSTPAGGVSVRRNVHQSLQDAAVEDDGVATQRLSLPPGSRPVSVPGSRTVSATGSPSAAHSGGRCILAECISPPLDAQFGETCGSLDVDVTRLPEHPETPPRPAPRSDDGEISDIEEITPDAPRGSPPDMQVRNARTAMVPLDLTPRGTGPLASELRSQVPAASAQEECLEVKLHIYDVSKEASVQRLNAVLAHRRSPLKFGGVFHAGIEVAGKEWSFGHCIGATGVRSGEPKADPQHTFRQTVVLPPTRLSEPAVASLLAQLQDEYPGHTYNILRRNCCHFADDLCQRLGVGRIPGWVYRLARIGARVDNVLKLPRAASRSPSVEGGAADHLRAPLLE